jgi:hypothetical protein
MTLKKITQMKQMTVKEKQILNISKICHFCKNMIRQFEIKVRDQCHITGDQHIC